MQAAIPFYFYRVELAVDCDPAVLLFFLVKTIIVSGNLELAQGDSGRRPEPRPVSMPSRRSLKRLERRLLQHDQALHALRLHQTVGDA